VAQNGRLKQAARRRNDDAADAASKFAARGTFCCVAMPKEGSQQIIARRSRMMGSTTHRRNVPASTDRHDPTWDDVVGEFRQSLLSARLAASLAEADRRPPPPSGLPRPAQASGAVVRPFPPRGLPRS
jgi:hypothetical protein